MGIRRDLPDFSGTIALGLCAVVVLAGRGPPWLTSLQQSSPRVITVPRTGRGPGEAVIGVDPRRGRILLVEDDECCRETLSTVFRQAGYETCEAESGEEALETARREQLTLVVLDVCLPGISGYEVCHELKIGRAHV